ncbi:MULTISPECIES: hypothetical protein [Cyanophyceae]|uniref:hypothetical protein n=1 Tax=Cyanophyceae TaxID=3028117 RepID=UPI001683E9A3|nr:MULTISPECIES: hypothetical protein [Cyanophyceae]MBD1916369.1 hypothetical protein [Phormidium sp. FACHB-77]MBD2032661.1 hypothetical protein [Phormidium sp. FACHB-322]MBD2050033.1 hypothetical protein [Leptolyngbya sp. FACHB-60]
MKLNVALLSAAVVGAVASQAQAQQVPNYYVGAGVRAGFNDDTSFVIDSKAKVTELGDRTTLSVRPSLVFDNSTELRLPISVDYALDQALYPYAGAGVAYNADGRSGIDPMITAGLDWGITRSVVIDFNASMLFKPGDTDAEITATVNYAF